MNIKESAEHILRIGIKVNEDDSFTGYENSIKEITKVLTQWYETGKAASVYEIRQLLNQEYVRGYEQGEKETHDNYKLGIY